RPMLRRRSSGILSTIPRPLWESFRRSRRGSPQIPRRRATLTVRLLSASSMNSSPQTEQRWPRSTKVSPSISERMSSTACSSPFPHFGHFIASSPLGAGYDEDQSRLSEVAQNQLLRSALSNPDLQLSMPLRHDPHRTSQSVPQVVHVPIPLSH